MALSRHPSIRWTSKVPASACSFAPKSVSRAGGQSSGGGWLSARREAFGFADDRNDQIIGLQQAFGNALQIVECDGLDLRIALVDVVDAHLLAHDPQQLIGDLGIAVEA